MRASSALASSIFLSSSSHSCFNSRIKCSSLPEKEESPSVKMSCSCVTR
jgi:hypothetical protein